MTEEATIPLKFADLGLNAPVLKVLKEIGYEIPTPIQAQTIPHILDGRDVLGQAQTGTGKTAAFALPLLCRIDITRLKPQVLVLAPTRELAIQVSEAFQGYAAHLKKFHVVPIYGGTTYEGQLRHLRRGVHVVVGTPGRIMDHMRQQTLDLSELECLVLDEADEMLRMGFIDDVEWVLERTPEHRQIALFSATMPPVIKRIAGKHLNDPVEIRIQRKTTTAETIHQRYWIVGRMHKLDALTRILEAETGEGILIFVRTKTVTMELAEKLQARGEDAVALNGDIAQNNRERIINQFKAGKINILVATDVAARGLDVDRISHVINYDIPTDTDSYVHRIGRTGRAGRAGEAITFVEPREKRMLLSIEQAIKKKIELFKMPSTKDLNTIRIAKFKMRISQTIETGDLDFFHSLVEQYQTEHNVTGLEIAAALAKMVQGDDPLLFETIAPDAAGAERSGKPPRGESRERAGGRGSSVRMESYRAEVGRNHKVQPGNIVGAIANEAGIESRYIGRINIYDEYSIIDLPEGMPKDMLQQLKKIRVGGFKLNISLLKGGKPPRPEKGPVASAQGRKNMGKFGGRK
ncbi:MAG: DEAD/DEAH box helicase [Chitinispirillaceae bacterium]|nr:DEAD/DEAH box helicase [Chitinispirillaceae bacterium]